jgi:hypothetical protein
VLGAVVVTEVVADDLPRSQQIALVVARNVNNRCLHRRANEFDRRLIRCDATVTNDLVFTTTLDGR